VQVVVFLFSMLPVLPGFHLLGGLRHLADAGWGRDEDGEAQHREHQHANANCSVAKHDLLPPIRLGTVSLYPICVETGTWFIGARRYARRIFSIQIEAK
jgi:hypothetical protein